MSASKSLNITLLIACTVFIQPAIASAGVSSGPAAGQEKISAGVAQEQYRETLSQANKMLGYISLAYFSSDLDLTDSAMVDIAAAQRLAGRLENLAPTFVTESRIKYGKITYDIKGEERSYYIPVVDDEYLMRDYDDILNSRKGIDVVERDARLVTAKLNLDFRQVSRYLIIALNDIRNERYNSARVALGTLYHSALADESNVEQPLRSIHDNLKLAQSLLGGKQYTSARFSLEHAREQLDILEQANPTRVDSQSILKVGGEMFSLEKQLRDKNPELLLKAEHEVDNWIRTVDGWSVSAGNTTG